MTTPENSEPDKPVAVPLSDQLGLVERLRQRVTATYARNERLAGALYQIGTAVDPLCAEAATEIERLRAALDVIAQHVSSDWPERCQSNVRTAREALRPNVGIEAGP